MKIVHIIDDGDVKPPEEHRFCYAWGAVHGVPWRSFCEMVTSAIRGQFSGGSMSKSVWNWLDSVCTFGAFVKYAQQLRLSGRRATGRCSVLHAWWVEHISSHQHQQQVAVDRSVTCTSMTNDRHAQTVHGSQQLSVTTEVMYACLKLCCAVGRHCAADAMWLFINRLSYSIVVFLSDCLTDRLRHPRRWSRVSITCWLRWWDGRAGRASLLLGLSRDAVDDRDLIRVCRAPVRRQWRSSAPPRCAVRRRRVSIAMQSVLSISERPTCSDYTTPPAAAATMREHSCIFSLSIECLRRVIVEQHV